MTENSTILPRKVGGKVQWWFAFQYPYRNPTRKTQHALPSRQHSQLFVAALGTGVYQYGDSGSFSNSITRDRDNVYK